ncbi:MAG: enoyl-CoA hydratase/isomerase family protein [Betaproteobacteria bacterium]|nr:enoyl-CoA hydratase/isomerase family protein [Betaproteobacteria bacterium]MCC7218162.1 enoyl-CoA hydratase/isomerase family protein [Burkholderiales bacterium]
MNTRYANPLLAAPTRPLPRHVAILGAGSIGPDIGYYLKSALPGLALTLVDVAQPAVDAALKRFAGYAAKAVERGKLRANEAAAVLRDVHGTIDYDAIRPCDWVIEAATENLELKRSIFADVEARVAADAIVTSNTSSLPASRIFSRMRHPGRATVTHFFAPAWRNPAVEVVDWPGAAPGLVDHLRRVFCATGKLPLVTADAVCFMLDRIFDNWCNEAALLLDRATAAEIDTVASEFVHAGPFYVLNLARGNPIIVETNTLQADEEGEHYRPAPVFRSVDGWITGAPGRRVDVAPALAPAIRDRLLGVLFSQAVDILDRGIGSAADLDLGCRIALGFRHGPLALMQALGQGEAARVLDRFVHERPGMPGPRRALSDYQGFLRHVTVDDVDDVKVITLRRPEALNALHDDMTDEILAVIRRHEADEAVRGFVVTGYGAKAFCAGADIGRFPSLLGDADASAQYARDCSRLLVHLDTMTKPVVAALNGLALGGGLELALRCRSIVAVRDAWLQFPEITLGIVPGIGAMVVPYRRWPQAAAVFHDMLRRAEKLDAARAHALGIVAALADDPRELVVRAVRQVRALAGMPNDVAAGPIAIPPLAPVAAVGPDGLALSPTAIALMEDAIRGAAAASTLASALEIGYRAFGASACTAAAREGIGAFGEHRRADFTKTG